MHAESMLCQENAIPQSFVSFLVLPTLPCALDLRSAHKEFVFLRLLAACHAPSQGLDAHDLCHNLHEGLLGTPLTNGGLDLDSSHVSPSCHEIHASLLAPQDGLRVPYEKHDGLVHVPPDLPSPMSLDQGNALDEHLQAGKFQSLVCCLLEKHHALAYSPRRPTMLVWWNVQLRVKMLKQFLHSKFRIVQMLQARDNGEGGKDLVIIPALLMVDADRIASTTDLNHLQDASIAELLHDRLPVVLVRCIQRVGLDAPDEVWLGRVHDVHEGRQLLFEFRRHRVLLLLGSRFLGRT
mmetsp:Transcript_145626/g.256748  ORF Transcript_145626/g.256748 Transcript_145626/m.256748 type:complete len:294 (+) Transcript_145626:2475-3356(+)